MSVFRFLILIPAIILFAIWVSEILARYWLRAKAEYFVWPPHYRREFDPERSMFPDFPAHVRFIINSEGERGNEIPSHYNKLYRVLVAGGSAPECYMLDHEGTWPMLLQRILERPENLKILGASHVHVGNIGKSGVGAEALELILKKVLNRIGHVDMIIIMVGASDVFNWLHAGAPPTPVRAITSSKDESRYLAWQPHGPFAWRPKRSALAEIARRFRQVVFRPVDTRRESGSSVRRAKKMRANALEVRTEVPNVQPLVTNFELYFRRSVNIAKAKADRVIVARQPWLPENNAGDQEWEHLWHGAVGDVFREEVKVFYSTEVLCRLMSYIDASAARVARELCVECCDVASAVEPTFKSFYDLMHFTPAGAAAVAKVIGEAIVTDTCQRHTSSREVELQIPD